jgi:hypothetical protein
LREGLCTAFSLIFVSARSISGAISLGDGSGKRASKPAARSASFCSGDGQAALVVRRDGMAFRIRGNDADVDLSRRLPLARILATLARHRVDLPGEGLRVEDILAAGWPGERIRYEAGANRVYVAVAELRKLGLREWLVSERGVYRLATSRSVVLEGAPTAVSI